MSENGVTKRVVFALAASVMLSGLTAGCRYRSAARSTACKQRGIAFSSQVEGLRRAALEKLTIGATKEDVVRFFAENKFPITLPNPVRRERFTPQDVRRKDAARIRP